MMGFGLPDDNLHAPNEKFHIANFYRGIESTRGSAPAPEGALAVLHQSARGTRGAAAAVAWFDTQTLGGGIGSLE